MAVRILITSIVPNTSNKMIFTPLLLLWTIFAFFTSNKSFINTFFKLRIKSYAIYVWLIGYFVFFITGYAIGIDAYLLNYIRIGFSILMFDYYIELNDYKVIKKLTLVSITLIVFVCITTIKVLSTNKDAARILATGIEDLAQNLHGIIGGYGFIYSLVFMCIVILGCFVDGTIKKNKVLWILILGLLLITIFEASFMIAIILLAAISLLIIFKVNKFSHFLFLFLLMAIFIELCLPFISDGLIFLANSVESQSMSMRFNELNQFIIDGNAGGTVDMGGRFNLYMISIKSFLSSPLIGVGGAYGYITFGIGGHSAFLDEIAKYGILGSASLFIGLIENMKYIYKKFDKKQKNIYMKCIVAFFILGFTNTILFVPIIVVVFFVVPGLLIYLRDYNELKQVVK